MHLLKRSLALFLFSLISLLSTRAAHAQSNYRIAPIGGRSTLLGGTGMTYGRDATAAFLNPATGVLLDDTRLSFSVNFYTMSFVYAPSWYRPGPIDRTKFGDLQIDDALMTDLEFNALPSSLCVFFRAGDVSAFRRAKKDPRTREARIGLCFATIQSQTFNFAAEGFSSTQTPGVTRQAQTLSQSFARFAAGPTYAMHISNAIAIGASFHGSLASHRSLLAASATTYGSTATPINSMFYSGSRGDSFQLEGIVGATLRFGRQTVGLSIKSPSVHVYGVGGANQNSHFDGAGSASSTISTSGSFVSRSPLRLGLGTGFENERGQFELNMFVTPRLGSSYTAELEGSKIDTDGDQRVTDRPIVLNLHEPARGVVNFAVGGEVFMSDHVSLLSGISTDFSAVPDGALRRGDLFNYYPYRTHRVSASFGLGSHGSGGEVLIGGELSVGWGERLAVNSYQLPPVVGTTGHGTYQVMLVIAGSTSLRAIKRAVDDVRDVIKDPGKQPHNPSIPKKPDLKPGLYNPAAPENQGPPKEPPPPEPKQ
jgi:hypothetical protein